MIIESLDTIEIPMIIVDTPSNQSRKHLRADS